MYKNEQKRTRGVTTDWREWNIEEQFHPAAQIVYHCGESERFLEQIPRGQIDLIVTSPPYNWERNMKRKKPWTGIWSIRPLSCGNLFP